MFANRKGQSAAFGAENQTGCKGTTNICILQQFVKISRFFRQKEVFFSVLSKEKHYSVSNSRRWSAI